MFLVFVFCAYVVIVVLSMIIFYVLFIMCPCVSSRLSLSTYSIYMFSFLYVFLLFFACGFVYLFVCFCLGLDSVCV